MLPDVVTYGNLATVGAPRDSHLGSVESAGEEGFSVYPLVLCLLNFVSSVTMKDTILLIYFGYCFFLKIRFMGKKSSSYLYSEDFSIFDFPVFV